MGGRQDDLTWKSSTFLDIYPNPLGLWGREEHLGTRLGDIWGLSQPTHWNFAAFTAACCSQVSSHPTLPKMICCCLGVPTTRIGQRWGHLISSHSLRLCSFSWGDILNQIGKNDLGPLINIKKIGFKDLQNKPLWIRNIENHQTPNNVSKTKLLEEWKGGKNSRTPP